MSTFEEAHDAIAALGWVEIEITKAANRGRGTIPKALYKREVRAVETCLTLMLGRKPDQQELASTLNRLK